MDPKLRPHDGVDLRSLSHCLNNYEAPISDEESERRERLFMGMYPSHPLTLPFKCSMWLRSFAEALPQQKPIPWGMTKYI
jgi:hypothetical protein